MKKLIIVCTLAFSFSLIYAQKMPEFTQDTGKFITELDGIFGSSLAETEVAVFDTFKINWERIDYSSQLEILQIADLMRERGFKARPHFIKYLSILNAFHGKGLTGLGYDDWSIGYRALLESPDLVLKDMNNFQNSSQLLLGRNILFTSRSLTWKLVAGDFRFVYGDSTYIELNNADLLCYTRDDSLMIHDVEGRADPLSYMFVGSKGTVYWERSGFSKEETFAQLAYFTVNLAFSEYSAENVLLTHRALFDTPVEGRLEDKVSFARTEAQVMYPKFFTYQSGFTIRDIVPGINYSGGLSMQGSHLAGTSLEGSKALMEIFKDDTLRVKLTSKVFRFTSGAISSDHAEVSVYIENDSIYHPDVIMNYNINTERLRLMKSNDYNSQGPYSNSYHMIDMNFAELSWNRKENVMDFQPTLGSAMSTAWFESYDFYNDVVYNSLQNVLEYTNPLANLYQYSNWLGSDVFAVTGYTTYMGYDPSQERHRLMDLSRRGFIYFNFEEDMVYVRAKLYDYIDAFMKLRDYDVIRFRSDITAGEKNATLDLATKDLTIHGIPNIFLSDSQNVRLVPTGNQITMKRNRNFQFDGIIDAGLFKFYGQNFFFEYDLFLINLQNIDSLSISAQTGEKNAYGEDILVNIDNKIENVTGELLIDAPFNKSGLEDYPDYPIFTSREKSYIYFDEGNIQGGIYDRERFYFALEPFSIDSLDNFTRTAMRMAGTFVSADIMPPLEMEMSLRPDNSLGFYMTTPEEGLPLFGGKATFYNDIEMSSKGLHGYGSMDYITSTTWSDDFLFLPDSITTSSRQFLEREKLEATSYPLVENTIAQVTFIPEDDVMHLKRTNDPFKMYKEHTTFGGSLALRPSGLSGNGSFALEDGVLSSRALHFEAQRISADSASVKVRPGLNADFTLTTDNVGVDVDLVKREGSMVAREDNTLVEFPENLYITRLDRIEWSMDKDELSLSQEKILPENKVNIGIDSLDSVYGPSYMSRHIDHDSLNFIAPLAVFNYSEKRIMADKVPYIEVGDSYIFPAGGDVEIGVSARMSPLRHAKILANTSSRHHELYDATLVVDSRNYYSGSAMCDYIDEFGTVYPFLLSSLEVHRSGETQGSGTVEQEAEFMMSPYMEYKGEIRLNARDSLLTFFGGVRLPHACDINREWMRFETRIDPDSIMIPVERNIKNFELDPISASPMVARDSTHIYPAFISEKKGPYDKNMITPGGYLYYDKATEYYEIAREDKLNDMDLEGNYLRLETDSCRLYGEGILDLKLDFGRVEMASTGVVTHTVDPNEMKMHMLLGLDFHFSPEALRVIGAEIDSLADLEPVDLTSSFYQLAMRNLVGTEIADRLETDLGLYGTYTEVPEELNYELFFNDVWLEWKQSTNSFRYNGKIGIGMIGDVQVNKKVDAYIEFVDKGADIFDIYLKVDNNTWYYFAFSNGVFQALSSNSEFNTILSEIKNKERKLKSRDGKPAYVYSEASRQRLSRFINKFELTEAPPPEEDDFEDIQMQ